MKTIIIYESGTGFTEQYAKWISEALDCECKKLKKVSPSELKEFDRIIFGGWIMGGGIMGLEKIRSIKKPFAVFMFHGAYDVPVQHLKAKKLFLQ